MTYAEYKEKFGIQDRPVEPPRRGRPPKTGATLDSEQGNDVTKISLADLSKDDLLQFAGKRKLYDKSFKGLEPSAIIPIILDKAYAKVLAANLIPSGENLETVSETDLFTWFDAIGN